MSEQNPELQQVFQGERNNEEVQMKDYTENEQKNIRQQETKRRLLEAVSQGKETSELLWETLVAWQEVPFRTVSGLPFTYTIRQGKRGQLTKELWIDRREGSKSLSFGSIRLAFENACRIKYAERPKAMGDIRGVSYMYPVFWTLGLIDVPPQYAEKMKV